MYESVLQLIHIKIKLSCIFTINVYESIFGQNEKIGHILGYITDISVS